MIFLKTLLRFIKNIIIIHLVKLGARGNLLGEKKGKRVVAKGGSIDGEKTHRSISLRLKTLLRFIYYFYIVYINMSNYSSKPTQKPLKGVDIQANSINVGTLSASSVALENVSIAGVYSDGVFQNVVITNSNINNTPIGIGGESVGFFTNLQTSQDVLFQGTGLNEYVSWNALDNTFSIGGTFELSGCAYLGNIEICVNTISATNLNGNINIIPNSQGIVNVIGSINNVSTTGNFTSINKNGSFNASSYQEVSIGSSYSSTNLSSYSEQNVRTINGDINLTTELGTFSKAISNITLLTSGNLFSTGNVGIYQITTSIDHDLRSNNNVNVYGTGYSFFDGNYTISSIIDNSNFTFTSGNITLTQGSSGDFLKIVNNNINLSAGKFINIPSNVNVNYGSTMSNIVGDSSGNLSVSSLNNINITSNQINIPINTLLNFGQLSYISANTSGTLNISSNTLVSGSLTQLNSTNTRIHDPIITLGDYCLTSNDYLDRGIEFLYTNTIANSLGWFGYKNNLNAYALLLNATNSNEIITGQYADLYLNNMTMSGEIVLNGNNNQINLNCGKLINVNTITGCNNTLNLNSNLVNVNSTTVNLNASSSVNIPNNTNLMLGTSVVHESTIGDLQLSSNNVYLNAIKNVILPSGVKLSLDGTTNGSNYISTSIGNLIIQSNTGPINLSSGNIIIPQNSNIQIGNSQNIIYGNTNGTILNTNYNTTINSGMTTSIIGNNISNLAGNGDVLLYSTNGNVRISPNVNLVFGIANTTNSMSSSNGNLIMYGNKDLNLLNFQNMNLNASSTVNILDNVRLNIGTDHQKFIYSDTNGNLNIVNNDNSINVSSNNINSSTLNYSINSTNYNSIAQNTNFTSSNMNIASNTFYVNTSNYLTTNPIPVIGYNNNNSVDKGISYNYSGNSLGWFGYKTATNKFTFYNSATNSNNIITGTLGDIQIGTLYADTGINLNGNINLNCNSLINASSISSCNGTITITAGNINLSSNQINIPQNSPIVFGTTGSILNDTLGNLSVTFNNVVLNGNLIGNGSTTNLYSTTTNIQDQIISIGGVTAPIINDTKDRGIEFKYYKGTGFFGYQSSSERFVFIPNGTNLYKVYYGSFGNVQFGNGYLTNIDLSTGAGNLTGTTFISSNTSSNLLNISSQNIILTGTTNIPYNNYLYFGSSANIYSGSFGSLQISSDSLVLKQSNSIQVIGSTPIQFNGNTSVYDNSNFNIVNTTGSINLWSNSSINVKSPINFNSTSAQIYATSGALALRGYPGVNISTNSGGIINLTGDVNIVGNLSAVSTDIDLNKFILPLGTSQELIVNSLSNSNGNVIVTTNLNSYVSSGDFITLTNVNSIPTVNGCFQVTSVINSNTFTINNTTRILVNATFGNFKSNLTTNPNKDVGIQVNYYENNNITSGSINYQTGFFGYKYALNQFVFYDQATIANNIVTGNLGTVSMDSLNTNNISGFNLTGNVSTGNNQVAGSNFVITGGSIDDTPIGVNNAQSGRFNILSNTVSAAFENVSLLSTFSLSFERFTLSSQLPSRDPTTNTVVSFISVNGVSLHTYGTLGNANVSDGQLKTIICSSIGSNCTYTMFVGAGNLIAPNISNSDLLPQNLQFNRAGQSVQMIFDNNLSAWVVLGRGCYIF